MSREPLISVVMCAYNAAPYIGRAVESILAQTYQDFELIIVDDGSTDDTVSVIEPLANGDPRIRFIAAPHQGISAAANLGIAAARYRWIARADADDIALPHRFERQLAAAAAEPGVVLWGSYALHVDGAERVLGLSCTGPRTVAQFHRLRAGGDDAYVLHPTWLVRRDVLLAAGGYDPRFECGEDLDMLERIHEHGPALTIAEPLVRYRVHSSSLSMRRFTVMRRNTQYLRARRRARLAGGDLTMEEFARQVAGRPWPERAFAALQTGSAFSYRQAGVSFAAGRRAAAAWWFTAAALLNPAYALPRIWGQVLSAPARRLRRA
jgi:glycosyltransferase involved in cell wall biosynthesis